MNEFDSKYCECDHKDDHADDDKDTDMWGSKLPPKINKTN